MGRNQQCSHGRSAVTQQPSVAATRLLTHRRPEATEPSGAPIDEHALGEDGRPTGRGRSTVGRLRSADETAARIDEALWAGRPRLFPERGTVVASLLWRLAPAAYLAQVRRRFADDLR
jgi:hypothetical protein